MTREGMARTLSQIAHTVLHLIIGGLQVIPVSCRQVRLGDNYPTFYQRFWVQSDHPIVGPLVRETYQWLAEALREGSCVPCCRRAMHLMQGYLLC
jgi:hypothetical protein